MAKRKALFMVCLLTVAFGFTALVVLFAEKKEKTDGLLCVTSFYPVQLLAESVSAGAEGVTVRNLTENHSGCIHDYTLTTQDMRLLSEAEVFLINGGEMELFLEKAASEYKNLTIVDTSEGYEFLEGVGHAHDHGEAAEEGHPEDCTNPTHHHEEEYDEAHVESCTDPTHHHEEEQDSHDGHSHAINAHIWMDIDGYLLQLERVEKAFVHADPAQAALYHKNAEACRNELTTLKEEYEATRTALAGKETVVFHEGFVYLFNMLGVESVHCLAMDSDTQIAAGEAAEIMEECRLHGITVLFAEEAYAKNVTDTFGRELDGTVVTLDPVTGTDISGDAISGVTEYCVRMRRNLERILEVYGVR